MPIQRKLTLADEMHLVHAALRNDLDRLRAALAAPAETRRFLGELRAHVVRHFRCEEDGGYMTVVLQCRPQSERTVRQLLAEHSLLLEGLDVLLTEAETAERIDDGFRARAGVWAELLRRHEAAENLLVEEAFNREIGAED